ncbi:MAG: hypothetical protein DRQ56_03565 [Gammaproteobacteria bacterium]|nr:MAG: hypothetical protein DRQ56_03565 [Gammaproteobacteria bacterium]
MDNETKSPEKKKAPVKRPLTVVRLYKGNLDFMEANNIDGKTVTAHELMLVMGDAIRDEAVAKG